MQDNLDFNRGAVRPIQCLSDGYTLLKGNYGGFLGVLIIGYLIIIVSAFIPLTPLMPPIICGLYLCLFAMMRREHFSTSTLFQGFNFFGQSFLASLFVTIPMFCLSILMQVGIVGFSAYIETLNLGENPPVEKVLPILYSFFGFIFGFLILFVVVAFILGIMMAFVYPLIVDRQLSAFHAVKLSIRAVMGNLFGVVGLTLLGQLILFAGLMFFYIGALFVAPIILGAWAVAYSRVFHQQVHNPVNQMNAPQYSAMTPPISTSKAGWVLTLCALLIVGFGVTSFAALGIYAYHGISNAIAKKAEEDRQKRENSDSDILFPKPKTDEPTTEIDESKTPSTDSGKTKKISGGVLNGKAISLPKPEYSPAAKAVKASGSINVSVVINEKGKVISATAVSGHPLLRASAVAAARKAKFPPQKLNGKPVQVTGVLVYTFKANTD